MKAVRFIGKEVFSLLERESVDGFGFAVYYHSLPNKIAWRFLLIILRPV